MRDKQSSGRSEVAALAERVANARGRLPLQDDAALVQVLSDAEIDAERELAEWVRAQRRGQRKRAVEDELSTETRDRRTMAAIQRADDADARWHRRALAARRRVSNQDARLAQLYRRAEWSSRALIAVVVLGMVWAGVNVQHNLVPSGNMADPLYWLSYGIEAMISIPIITIMVAATTAARWGRELDRGKVVFFETALLGTTVALNAGPHLAAGAFGQAAEYAIAPVMVGVVIWLHAWVSARYALLIDSVPMVEDEPDLPTRHRVTTERGAPITTFRADDPADRRELLAATGFDPLLDQAGVRFPVDMTEPHLAEPAVHGTPQPADTVPVSRLDCTETLVYHAQSTRSTNGRLPQPIPTVDEYNRPDHRDPARSFNGPATQPISDYIATNSVTAGSDTAARATPSTTAPSAPGEYAPSSATKATAPNGTMAEAPRPTHAMGVTPSNSGMPSAATIPREPGERIPSSAANTTVQNGAMVEGGSWPSSAPNSAAQNGAIVDGDPRFTHTPASTMDDIPANSAAHLRSASQRIPSSASNATARDDAMVAGGSRPTGAVGDTPTATNGAMLSGSPTTPDSPVVATNAVAHAQGTAQPNHWLATAANPDGENVIHGPDVDPRLAFDTAAGRPDERTAHSAADIETHTAATGASYMGGRTAHAGASAETHTASTTGASSVDGRATGATAGDELYTVSASSANAYGESTNSVAAEVEPHVVTAPGPSVESQLSINFDVATVEPELRAEAGGSNGNRVPADLTRVAESSRRVETAMRTDSSAAARNTDRSSAAPNPAERSARMSMEPQAPQHSTETAAEPRANERNTRTAAQPQTNGHIVRAAVTPHAVQQPSIVERSATDHQDPPSRTEETAEAEVRPLVADDRSHRRTTSEVISDVVQSLSAEDLLIENPTLGSESDDVEVWSVARAIAGRGLSVIPVEQLAEILMLADQSWTPTSIGAEVGLSRTAIAQVLEFARKVRRPYAISS
ncbi:hypothetical protein OG874_39980 [Nocardia sp. NBC_00565]|uniref:hypothetical protein n=1 Tax=Nocardia sp. NBC_00565 TaxID=2975993 RepID=UPI002E807974|nr:hypothetical protein [Nocardia sp. NBC_00565]WUC02812.1 hypothetical protein OG874_39980 [Nocardia sp. NBC_00565]